MVHRASRVFSFAFVYRFRCLFIKLYIPPKSIVAVVGSLCRNVNSKDSLD